MKFAGVEVSKLSFLGLDFDKFGNPSALYLAIWVSFFYFLFRYYQYFSQEGRQKLSRYFYEELERHIMDRISNLANQINEGAVFHPKQLALLERGSWSIRVSYDSGPNGSGGRNKETRNIIFPTKELPKLKALSFIKISLNTSLITDYVLPFIIAAISLLYSGYGAQSGLYEAIFYGFRWIQHYQK